MTVRKANRMDEAEILRRAQEPGDRAEQRKLEAKSLLQDMQTRDDEVIARMEKLKALRLAAAPVVTAPAASKKPAAKSAAKPAKPKRVSATR